ncbi:MAG: hypothetical protein ABI140_07940 [Jatrophihabitantaceae bacterium]
MNGNAEVLGCVSAAAEICSLVEAGGVLLAEISLPALDGGFGGPGVPGVPGVLAQHSPLALPSRPMPLPHTVTGAVTGTAMRLPPVLAGVLAAGGVQLAVARPSRPMPLPHTVTGAVTGTATAALPAALDGARAAGGVQLAVARPIALPQIDTGTVIGMLAAGRDACCASPCRTVPPACCPLDCDCRTGVAEAGVAGAAEAGAGRAGVLVAEPCPSSPIALPLT